MLNKNGVSVHFFLIPKLTGNLCDNSLLSERLPGGFLQMLFIKLRKLPLTPTLQRVFDMIGN